jgi:hypothetical protein
VGTQFLEVNESNEFKFIITDKVKVRRGFREGVGVMKANPTVMVIQ